MSMKVSDAIFWIAVVSCSVAQLLIMRAVFHKPLVPSSGDDTSPAGSRSVPHPRRTSEFAWALLPAVLLALLFVGAWRTMHRHSVTSVSSTVAPSPDAGVATQP
jgi:ABC-type dipeptide/oligopeptide/nickel transport system permease component